MISIGCWSSDETTIVDRMPQPQSILSSKSAQTRKPDTCLPPIHPVTLDIAQGVSTIKTIRELGSYLNFSQVHSFLLENSLWLENEQPACELPDKT